MPGLSHVVLPRSFLPTAWTFLRAVLSVSWPRVSEWWRESGLAGKEWNTRVVSLSKGDSFGGCLVFFRRGCYDLYCWIRIMIQKMLLQNIGQRSTSFPSVQQFTAEFFSEMVVASQSVRVYWLQCSCCLPLPFVLASDPHNSRAVQPPRLQVRARTENKSSSTCNQKSNILFFSF